MKKLLTATLVALLSLSVYAVAQNTNSSTTTGSANANATKKRGPVFRATKEQIKQTQTILKQRGFYSGDVTGKLDTPTRDGLKKYQEAEGLKVTGTLNAATLQKMNITLTDKQNAWVAAQSQPSK
ncbi:MAG TPA: peptidoglycan-binding domain-containing protein [Pyrinomonadaceae bacterium]|nr:peptidoglycan-binding domain-containing protein [Pyrinomonadaceae bacterium]